MANIPDSPITRKEKYLDAIANGTTEVPEPITREEEYLAWIALNGGGGGGTGEVTGVKGSAESTFRKGNVSISPANIGLDKVNNTSDLNKPVSTPQQAALDLKVDKVDGKGLSDNNYSDDDKAIVDGVETELAKKVNKVTGKGLSTNDYTNDDKAIVDGVTDALSGKVDKVSGKTLSTNDYANADKEIVDGVADALAGKVDKVTGKGLSANDYTNTDKAIVDGVTAALAEKADKTDVIDGASYDSANHLILFKRGTDTLFSLDAAAFVKDGMVDTVSITGGNLVITFNTDAGKQAISIPISDIFDADNYYNKTATDNLLADKADKVSGATNGNLAGLDASGNLTDSGKKAADFALTNDLAVIKIPFNSITQISGYYMQTGTRVYVHIELHNKTKLADWAMLTENGAVPSPSAAITNIRTKELNYGLYIYATGKIAEAGGGGIEIGDYTFDFVYDTEDSSYFYNIGLENVNEVAGKADKVTSATSGNLASLDANGNLVDSGVSAGGVLTAKGALNESTDFNTIVAPGVYGFGSQNYIVNGPTGATYGVLTVFCTRNVSVSYNYIVQAYKNRGNSKSWHRLSTNGGTEWTDWFYSSTASEGTADILTAGTDTEQRSWSAKMLKDEFGGSGYLPLTNLGTEYTAELKADISSGKFEKAVVGGYLTINGHVYYLAHPDYWLHTGDTECTTHHMLVIPAEGIGTGKMNDTSITTGGYSGSDMKTGANSNTALATAAAQIKADFGASNILTHRELFANAVTDGKASGWAWADSDIDLMNEVMVYGCNVWASAPNYETGIDKCQLKLFQERPDLITTRADWWLRSVASDSGFACVAAAGYAAGFGAGNAVGVRPAFAIC